MKNQECKHRMVTILEFGPLGILVACNRCDATFEIPEENAERYFTHFKHTSARGPQYDREILVHDSML